MDTIQLLDQIESSEIQTRVEAIRAATSFNATLWRKALESIASSDGRSPVFEALLALVRAEREELLAAVQRSPDEIKGYLGVLIVERGDLSGVKLLEESLRMGTQPTALVAMTLAKHQVPGSGAWIVERLRTLNAEFDHLEMSTLVDALKLLKEPVPQDLAVTLLAENIAPWLRLAVKECIASCEKDGHTGTA